MKVLVVNLESSKQRRDSIKSQLDGHGISFEFFKAIDGHALSDEYLDNICDFDTLATRPHLLYKGMYGCILSHYGIYKKMIEENIPMVMVLEDDVLLHNDLKKILCYIENNIQTNEAILLFTQNDYMPIAFSSIGSIPINDKHRLSYPMSPWALGSTAAYVITLEAARNMVNYVLPIRVGPDAWGYFYEDKIIENIRCITPFLAKPAGFKSDIDYISKENIKGMILRLIDKYNLFPFKQILHYRRKISLGQRSQYTFSSEISPLQKQVL